MLTAAAQALRAITPIQAGCLTDSFRFTINGTPVCVSGNAASGFSPAVALQYSVDACAREFVVEDQEVNATAISFFESFISGSKSSVSLSPSDWGSLSFLFGHLWNTPLELACLCKEVQRKVPLRLESISLLSIEALENLLCEWSFCVEGVRSLFEVIVSHGCEYFPLLHHVKRNDLKGDLLSDFVEISLSGPSEWVWSVLWHVIPPLLCPPDPSVSGFSSLIVADFPALFAEFRNKRFTLLWRGSRDGFGARDFHKRCDLHANTLTLIQDTGGNIFGGFTPVKWEWSFRPKWKGDQSLKSFLFTLKNPHNFPARKFGLKAEAKDEAIICDSSWGPRFRDIRVSDYCNTNRESLTSFFGRSYTNDTRMNRMTFFTGSESFIVKEIEVFEITL
jgi:hypothetical protein